MNLKQRLRWEWNFPAALLEKRSRPLTYRFEHRTRNVKNLNRCSYFKYRPEVKLQINPLSFQNENAFKRFLEERLRLPDGNYALVSFDYETVPSWIRVQGGSWMRWNWRPFRWVYVFRWQNNSVTDVTAKSKGQKYGKRRRPKTYYAMSQYFQLRTAGLA